MIRIALIEDLHDFRNALASLINFTPGMRCVAAYQNGEEALAGIPEVPIDMCIVDINLPGLNGIELVKSIKQSEPDMLFMMCTAYEEDEKVFSALQAGAHSYILKASTPSRIIEAINELYQGGSPMSSDIARRVVTFFSADKNRSKPELDILTERETQVLQLLAKGFLYKEIAASANISLDTVRKHLQNIYRKLHVQTKLEAVNKYLGR